jgi:5S rRNA maturation endonuclease (ribonuclease M5)
MLQKLEVLKAHIQKLNRSSSDSVVVVEGKNDVLALRDLLAADFFILNKYKRSLYETAENLSSRYSSALLLLDTDEKGKELRKKMKSYLQLFGMKVKEENKLLRLARVRTVEDLSSAELVRLL